MASAVLVAVDPGEDGLVGHSRSRHVQPADQFDLNGHKEGLVHGVVHARFRPPG